jgi:protein gp37
MAESTNIEWADKTQSPWLGCQKVSAACDGCYAEAWGKRSGLVQWGPHADRRRTSDANWRKLDKWNREGRFSVFPSLCDPFDNHRSIEQSWRDDYWEKVRECDQLRFLLLTKRPQNVRKLCPFTYGDWPENVCVGATVENQDAADRSLRHLAQTPAPLRFISCEPLLGPIDLTKVLDGQYGHFNALTGETDDGAFVHAVDWVIVGGETGPNARPSSTQWYRDLRDQCRDHNVSFLMKQWGDWLPADQWRDSLHRHREGCRQDFSDNHLTYRIGRKHSGRSLDGVIHNEFPWVSA